jgi:hypothetical protein
MTKIEAFWENATTDEVAVIANTHKPIPARFRDEDKEDWQEYLLAGWKLRSSGARWIDSDGTTWNQCQVYREPFWYANKPDPGPGWRLLGKMPDEELKEHDEWWNGTRWGVSFRFASGPQSEGVWYRRRIEPVEPKFAVGQTVRVIGPKEKPALHWGKEIGLDWEEHNVIINNYPVNRSFVRSGFHIYKSFVTLHHWIE